MPTTEPTSGPTSGQASDLPPALAACRDAEDWFAALRVAYDPRVLDVGRLHVLRLFGRELEAVDRSDAAAVRGALERAYRALVEAGPLEHRLFKVLADRAPGQFVPLEQVTVEVTVEGGNDE